MALSIFKQAEIAFELRHETKGRVPLKTVPTQEALAMAVAAQRINGAYIKDTRRFSEVENKTQFANKEIVKFAYHGDPSYLPTDYVRPVPTEEDYVQVAEIQKWMRRYVMLGLGDLDDFKKDMIGAVVQDTVPVNNLGRVAFIPEFVKRDQHESGLKKEIRVEYRNSQYLGKEKDVVEGVVKILDKRYSQQWESFNYVAVIDGNLVSFMNKYEHAVGDMKRIKGKVKAQTQNKLFSANETRLNYVKLYKV
jgi:hypothetical protein|tara:strand:+ start:2376 stop:3125 length:750 start_codon:yes stop_codon:yes gene_type:complete